MASENDTIKTPPDFVDILNNVHGFLSLAEAKLLYMLAAQVPSGGTIVEIGNYEGRSTIAIALGAKASGARFYSIDPHEDTHLEDGTHYGMHNHAALLKNLVDFDVADTVRLIAFYSYAACEAFAPPLDMLFIDGNHEYGSVIADFMNWGVSVRKTGKILMHNSSGNFPDVTRALNEILASGKWKIEQRVDATTVLLRA